MLAKLKSILAYVYGVGTLAKSVAGYLNVAELVKVALPAILHGGGITAVLLVLSGSASAIFAAPYVGIAVAVLTAIVQVLRFLGKGEPAPASVVSAPARPVA